MILNSCFVRFEWRKHHNDWFPSYRWDVQDLPVCLSVYQPSFLEIAKTVSTNRSLIEKKPEACYNTLSLLAFVSSSLLTVYLIMCLSICLTGNLSVLPCILMCMWLFLFFGVCNLSAWHCLSVCLSLSLFFCLLFRMSVCLSVWLSVCLLLACLLSVCLSFLYSLSRYWVKEGVGLVAHFPLEDFAKINTPWPWPWPSHFMSACMSMFLSVNWSAVCFLFH